MNRLAIKVIYQHYCDWLRLSISSLSRGNGFVQNRKEYIQERYRISDDDLKRFHLLLTYNNYDAEEEIVNFIYNNWYNKSII